MKGTLEIHVKYMGQWLMKAGKRNVRLEDLIPELEQAMILMQRAVDKHQRGMKLDKNMIEFSSIEDFEKAEFNYPHESE